jgi:hypothetical protein
VVVRAPESRDGLANDVVETNDEDGLESDVAESDESAVRVS